MPLRTGGQDRDDPTSSGGRVVSLDCWFDVLFADDGQDGLGSLAERRPTAARELLLPAAPAPGSKNVSLVVERRGRAADPGRSGQDGVGRDAPVGALRRPAS